jgi:phenylacetate-CoA ligase
MSIFETVYDNSPKILQELELSIFGLKRDLKRNGYRFKQDLSFLMKSYYWDETEIKIFQLKKINELLDYIYENSEFYTKALNNLPRKINNIKELSSYPVLTKEILRNNFDVLLVNKKKLNYFYTSGTSGTPLKVALTSNEMSLENAFIWRQRLLAGVKKKNKLATFGGRKIVKSNENKQFWRMNYTNNQLLFSGYHMNEENIKSYISKYNQWKAGYIQGYPSSIYKIAKFALDRGMELYIPKAIFTSSETLLYYQREVIEKAFNSKIYDYYGSTERAGIITQCTHGKYHVNVESGFLEINDSKFYWTSFLNRSTPLLRYEIGDTGEYDLINKKCGCGSYFPRLSKINGREEDYIYTFDMRPLGRLDHIFKSGMQVKEAQLVQDKIGEVIVNIVPDHTFNLNEIEYKITKAFADRVGDTLDLKLNIMKEIPKGSNGKFKFVVSNIERR